MSREDIVSLVARGGLSQKAGGEESGKCCVS